MNKIRKSTPLDGSNFFAAWLLMCVIVLLLLLSVLIVERRAASLQVKLCDSYKSNSVMFTDGHWNAPFYPKECRN